MVSRFLEVLFLVSVFSFCEPSKQDYYGPGVNTQNYIDPKRTILVGKQQKEIHLDRYYNSSELEELLLKIEAEYKSIVKLHRIAYSSVDTKPIFAVQISQGVQEERAFLKPMFKFVANIRGCEAVGYALMVSLIQYLAYSYGSNDRITHMLNNTDIWIVPNLNPDGFARAKVSKYYSLEYFEFSTNGKAVNLDGDFPDQFDEDDFKRKLQRETEYMMYFIKDHPFVLSGNLQGGAVVANYPFDNSIKSNKTGLKSPTPDDALFQRLARLYAKRNTRMNYGRACGNNFTDGITNGNFWKKRAGDMQDYNYVNSNCFELTFYLSCCKYPQPEFLPFYWRENLKSMLKFIQNTHRGVYGTVMDFKGKPVQNAVIRVKGNAKEIKVTHRGEYWRLLIPEYGSRVLASAGPDKGLKVKGQDYEITASAPGYGDVTVTVQLRAAEKSTRQNFILQKNNGKALGSKNSIQKFLTKVVTSTKSISCIPK